MRRVLASLLPLLALTSCALAPGASAMSGTPRVVGGDPASSDTQVPWQALVKINLGGSMQALCGGAILDAQHVVTAAHCVYDEDTSQLSAPSAISVGTGSRTKSALVYTGVSSVVVDPDYSPVDQTSDAAILTLNPALSLGTTRAAIPLMASGRLQPAGTSYLLSGWGVTDPRGPYDPAPTNPQLPSTLQVATVQSTNGCQSVAIYQPFDSDALLCAAALGKDACQGDSGGPLAYFDSTAGAYVLAGLVTGGAGCASPGYPGYYAKVAYPPLNAFLASRGAGYTVGTPSFTTNPSVTGTPQPGQTLLCDRGQFNNAYTSYVEWNVDGVPVTDEETFLLYPMDVGHTISCTVEALGLSGSTQATSAGVRVVPVPSVQAPPTQTTPPPSTKPPADTIAPVAKLARITCKHNVCTLEVKVLDPAPTAGAQGVMGNVKTSYKATCKAKRGKKKKCTKSVTQRLTGKTAGTNIYKITTPKMRAGKHVFSLFALDLAGHTQATATKVTKTTR